VSTIGWIIVLLLVTLLLMTLEMLTPTFGILAGLGVVCLVAATWLAFTVGSGWGVTVLTAGLILIPLYVVASVKLLPKLPISRKLFLGDAERGEGEGTPRRSEYAAMVNLDGTAETDLRPIGRVEIEGKRYDAEAESGMIDRGEPVRVVRTIGMNLIVRRVERSGGDRG
jgi:membrane-bound serine protease (ClpP class)